MAIVKWFIPIPFHSAICPVGAETNQPRATPWDRMWHDQPALKGRNNRWRNTYHAFVGSFLVGLQSYSAGNFQGAVLGRAPAARPTPLQKGAGKPFRSIVDPALWD